MRAEIEMPEKKNEEHNKAAYTDIYSRDAKQENSHKVDENKRGRQTKVRKMKT